MRNITSVVYDPVGDIKSASPAEDRPRLRVVYLDHVARLSGGELALLHALPALRDRVQPLVVLAEDGPLVAELAKIGVECRVVPLSASVRDLRKGRSLSGLRVGPLLDLLHYVWTIRTLLRHERADLVHTNSLKSAMYGGVAGRLARVPVVWHIRDRIADDYLPGRAVRLVRGLSRVLPTGLIANSRTTLATLPAGRVLPPPPPSRSRVLTGPTRPERPLIVGVVGRLSPWKGQDVFLRAFAAAFPDGPEQAVLVGSAMFGEDVFAESLRTLAASLGIADRLSFRGFQADVNAELAAIDVLVHCSTLAEPLGQVVLEGMAAGLAVLASAEGGPAEIITDGVDGLLVPARDVPALARALRRVAADAEFRLRLGTAALVAAARFSPEATADGFLAVYDELAGRRNPGE